MITVKPRRLWMLSSLVGLVGACGVALGGCGGGDRPGNTSPSVVTTTTILTDLTEEIAGDEVEVSGILTPGDDPHVYEPVPQDTATLEGAELILYNG
ncbi:MAG: metal ABC transporter solute-binding protein, Zn/Mn family, partial [Cyanophyceae cyanobacterium]